MRTILFLAALGFSLPSFAHVKPGTYQGKDSDGQLCQFTVGEVWFENNQPHPLNERIPVAAIEFTGKNLAAPSWNLGHPPVVSLEKASVRFNHDLFQQTMPTSSGAAALTLLKGDENEEGSAPRGLIYMEDNYRDPSASKKFSCYL